MDERPVFFATAPKRAGGKTTAVNMISLAVTARKAAAAAWANDENERRKAMLPVLADGLPLLVWDNIELGAAISSPTTLSTSRVWLLSRKQFRTFVFTLIKKGHPS